MNLKVVSTPQLKAQIIRMDQKTNPTICVYKRLISKQAEGKRRAKNISLTNIIYLTK